jgi:predicted CXXCH cytochrome family protein
VVIAILGVLLAARGCVMRGWMTARQDGEGFEAPLARWLVTLGIPAADRSRANPLAPASDADLAAGRDLYQARCEACHGHDGSGGAFAATAMYPRPPRFREALPKRTDGEVFFLIRNGIRNTPMPGWQLPDRETWQLVLYLRALPLTSEAPPSVTARAPENERPPYVGSVACKGCHASIYERWSNTLMANVVRDPRDHPDAITPDLAKGGPLVTFTASDVAFVYGSKWKQRYFKKVGDDYFPLSAQWDVTHKAWKPYFVKDDWWAPLYPPSNDARPTGPLCDGCHSVNYDVKTHAVTEWNVGCERCHGPGGRHVKDPVASTIVNPARLDYVAANDTCIQCHSQGRPLSNPIEGRTYDWPVGYNVGSKLRDFWQLEEHKLGATTFTHFADGTAHKNRMQGNDYVQSAMYTHGVTCITCHDGHGASSDALLRKPANDLCLDCHGPRSPNGPKATSLAAHTHHKEGGAGSSCVGCHMPKIAQTIGDVNVRSHTFKFVSPARTEAQGVPNACNTCHADKTPRWAAEALARWSDRSPWRSND